MTDQLNPEDQELADRVRRSMAHYRYTLPLGAASISPRGVLRVASLFAAAAAGAVLTLAAVAALGGLPRGVGSGSPTPTPIEPGASVSATPSPSPTPDSLISVSEVEAKHACLAVRAPQVDDRWREEGNSKADVAARFARLPLLIVDRRAEAVVFVFADDRLVTACRFVVGQAAPETILRGIREPGEPSPARTGVLFVASDPVIVDDDGQPIPGSHPNTLAIGIASTDAQRVAIAMEDGTMLDARLAGGIWLAWWQENLSGVAIRAFDRQGGLIESVPADLEILEVPEDGVVLVTPAPAPSE